MKESGQLFVVTAPSGAGKTSLCKALITRLEQDREKPLLWSVSYTTRPARHGEVDGRDYFFVDDAAFDRMLSERAFAEWANVHGKRYGTSREHLAQAAGQGVDLLVEIDIQGAMQLREQYRGGRFIFILPPSWPALESRLRGRGTEAEAEVQRRLTRARDEILEWRRFDYIIVNDDFARALDHLRSVVLACRAKRDIMETTVGSILSGLKQEDLK